MCTLLGPDTDVADARVDAVYKLEHLMRENFWIKQEAYKYKETIYHQEKHIKVDYCKSVRGVEDPSKIH